MALVMLPCDLPWWPAVTKQLDRAAAARSTGDLVDAMLRLHDMCNISLDPDEDVQDPGLFDGLVRHLDEDLSPQERERVLSHTIPAIASRAKALKVNKPAQGLHFSLQQQGDSVEYSYAFVASLIANAFFSTYPKRTAKTHPTLRDFNFTNFFKHLHLKIQRAKLRGIFQYFEYLESGGAAALEGQLIISRQVLQSRQWLTIEDWLESQAPLCPLNIRHEGRLERAELEGKAAMQICFASRSLGGGVLDVAATQETIQMATHPELLAAMLFVESLEDNEALLVEGARHTAWIQDPRHRVNFEAIAEPSKVMVCCIDAEDYSALPLAQYEEDNVLRELNKALLGFRQGKPPQSPDNLDTEDPENGPARRLSPIGESFSSASPEMEHFNTTTCNTATSRGSMERTRGNGSSTRTASPGRVLKFSEDVARAGRRRRFIVLGSSGEALPVTRKSLAQSSVYDSCNSQSTDSFHSAKDTIEEEPENEEEDEKTSRKYSAQLDTPEQRGSFAQRLKDALKRESWATDTTSTKESSESSYAVGISVAGSQVADENIKVKRGGGSRGFVLRDETVDEEFLKESLEAEQKWLGRFRQSQPGMQRKETPGSNSSRYSFSTEYSSELCSELEEVYEQLSKWLDDPVPASDGREMDARDRAVLTFAGSLLKRALSESFAGVPVQEGEPQPLFDTSDVQQRHKLALAVRSLSLELARQKSRRQPESNDGAKNSQRRKLLAVSFTSEIFQTLSEDEARLPLPHAEPQKVSRDSSPHGAGLLCVATGNWGCGSRLKGHPQLKLVIQWLAASMAGVPRLIYYTYGHSMLTKLDTVSRVLTDRQWSVGDLAAATLRFATQTIEERLEGRNSLFEELIGMDKPSP